MSAPPEVSALQAQLVAAVRQKMTEAGVRPPSLLAVLMLVGYLRESPVDAAPADAAAWACRALQHASLSLAEREKAAIDFQQLATDLAPIKAKLYAEFAAALSASGSQH